MCAKQATSRCERFLSLCACVVLDEILNSYQNQYELPIPKIDEMRAFSVTAIFTKFLLLQCGFFSRFLKYLGLKYFIGCCKRYFSDEFERPWELAWNVCLWDVQALFILY